jgi:hypothetical protein
MTTIHISEENNAILERIKKQKRKGNKDEVLTLLIAEHEFLEQKKVNVEIPKEEDDSIRCINRILHDHNYWCVNKPPKMVKLLTLDICKVCKQRKIGLTESTKIDEAKPEQNPFPLYKGSKPLKQADVYCSYSGMYVYYKKCDSCTQFDCEVLKKRRQEKEVKT